MKINKTWAQLNGFAIEAKLLGISPLDGVPEYQDFKSACVSAHEIKKEGGEFLSFIKIFFPNFKVKWNAALDYYHGVDCLVVSPEGKYVSIDFSTYPKQECKAMINIVDKRPWGFWKQQIEKALNA